MMFRIIFRLTIFEISKTISLAQKLLAYIVCTLVPTSLSPQKLKTIPTFTELVTFTVLAR